MLWSSSGFKVTLALARERCRQDFDSLERVAAPASDRLLSLLDRLRTHNSRPSRARHGTARHGTARHGRHLSTPAPPPAQIKLALNTPAPVRLYPKEDEPLSQDKTGRRRRL